MFPSWSTALRYVVPLSVPLGVPASGLQVAFDAFTSFARSAA